VGSKEVIEKLSSDTSVKAVFPLEGELYDIVMAEEGSVTSATGMPLINRALKEVVKRSKAICIFCSSKFEPPMDHVMIMEDTDGNVVGHDIPVNMAHKYKNDENAIFISDDFVLYPDRTDMKDIAMVMLPQKVTSVGEAEGVKDAVLLYPATTTDVLLRKHFKIKMNDIDTASAILAFNIL